MPVNFSDRQVKDDNENALFLIFFFISFTLSFVDFENLQWFQWEPVFKNS